MLVDACKWAMSSAEWWVGGWVGCDPVGVDWRGTPTHRTLRQGLAGPSFKHLNHHTWDLGRTWDR